MEIDIWGKGSDSHRVMRSKVVTRDSAVGTAETSEDSPAPTSAFVVGIMWFFAHQLIGVGNDVIMKFTGQNLAVAQVCV